MTADMQGKVCLVTGANSGIGKETALGLAQLGATVVLVCRNQERGGAALAELKQQSGKKSKSVRFPCQKRLLKQSRALMSKPVSNPSKICAEKS